VLCEANLAVLNDLDLDIVQAISDPYREAADLGAAIHFPQDGLPVSVEPLLDVPGKLADLRPISPDAGARMNDRLQAIRRFRETVGGEVPIMGWVEGALAEAADLRGVQQLFVDLYDRPAWVEELLSFCVEIQVAFAWAQVQAGADIIGLGDAVASQISPAGYREWALPYEQRIFDAVHEAGAISRLHICGDTSRILCDMVESGAEIIDIDWMVDIEQAASVFGDGPALCGNVDPVAVLFRGTPEQVRQATMACARQGGGKWLCAAGCEVPDGTPLYNLRAQSQALREYAQ
jgi:MtaA/CmuA family methyltransferase